jgi:hypothetical protein
MRPKSRIVLQGGGFLMRLMLDTYPIEAIILATVRSSPHPWLRLHLSLLHDLRVATLLEVPDMRLRTYLVDP